MKRHCYKCKQPGGGGKRELRPYGPNGADVCAGCVFGNDESGPDQALLEQAKKQLAKQVAMAGSRVLVLGAGEQAGPRAPTAEEKNLFDPS